MEQVSPELERDIENRLARGTHATLDELLRDALLALDDAGAAAEALLERELLAGLEGEDKPLTEETWNAIEKRALEAAKSKKHE